MHTWHRQIIHAKIGVLTSRCVWMGATDRVHPDPGAFIKVVLHFAGDPALHTAHAPIQINNQTISFTHSSYLLGFFNLTHDILHLHYGLGSRFLRLVDGSAGQLIMSTLDEILSPPSLTDTD